MGFEAKISDGNRDWNLQFEVASQGEGVVINGRNYTVTGPKEGLQLLFAKVPQLKQKQGAPLKVLGRFVRLSPSAKTEVGRVHKVAAAGGLMPAERGAAHESAMQWLHSFNSGDPVDMREFRNRLEAEPTQKDHKFDAWLFDRAQGFELVEELEVSSSTCTLLIREQCAFREYAQLTIELSAESSGKIKSLSLTPADGPEHPPVQRLSETAALSALDSELTRLASDNRFSGTIQVSRVGQEQALYSRSVGIADVSTKREMTANTQSNIASCGKMFTAIVIMQLVEEGIVSLDDQVGNFFPDLDSETREVTVKQLLTHTSGLGTVPERVLDQPKSPTEMVAMCKNLSPQFTSGSTWHYSNLGFLLLGAIAEKATDQSYYELVSEKIFDPAKMKQTDFHLDPHPSETVAQGYIRKRDGLHANSDEFKRRASPAGGAYSTPQDLALFAHALTRGDLVRPKTLEAMSSRTEVSTAGHKYALGLMCDEGYYGHPGKSDGVNAELRIYPESGYIVSVTGNLEPPAAEELAAFIGDRLPSS